MHEQNDIQLLQSLVLVKLEKCFITMYPCHSDSDPAFMNEQSRPCRENTDDLSMYAIYKQYVLIDSSLHAIKKRRVGITFKTNGRKQPTKHE